MDQHSELMEKFQHAVSLQRQGSIEEAIHAYRELLNQYPNHIASRYNLACLYADQAQWSEAIREFEQVLALEPTCTPACYNLAICWQGLSDDQQALIYLEKTLELEPHHELAAEALGSILLKQERYEEAKTYLITALQNSPTNADILFNIAIACLKEGKKIDALYYLAELLKHHPHHIDAEFNCAVIYQQDGNYPAALRAYERVLQLNPQHFASLYNSGLILQATQQYDQALQCYQRAYELGPHNKNLPFLINALKKQTPIAAPTEYVETLFDSYANHYDRHMQQQLQYNVPEQLFNLFSQQVASSNNTYTLIDLGCGTGLLGEYFKLLCHTLIGIDLSAAMLRQASLKQIYTTLNQQDNIAYLNKLHHDVDIIAAADVLGYYGELNELFKSSAQALRSGGWFLFSIETFPGKEDFHLQPTARFAHNPEYIEHLAQHYHFTLLAKQAATLRLQQEQAVAGYLYLFTYHG